MIAITSLLAVAMLFTLAAALGTADHIIRRYIRSRPAHVCAWCPDKDEQTRKHTLRGRLVSHDICGNCRSIQLNHIRK